MDINDRIKALRKQRGLTLEAVGEHVGVGKSTVRKWENGDIKNMRRDKIALLAEALGVTPGYLMGWEDDGAKEKLNGIEEQLTAPSRSKRWRMLSEAFGKMEQENEAEFMTYFNLLVMNRPDLFKEGDDDDADNPES